VQAASVCSDKRQFQIEYSRCLDHELDKMQRELTTWENSHLFRLGDLEKTTGRGDPLRTFKRSRQHLNKFMEDHCRWQYLALIPDSQAGSAVYKECMIEQLSIQVKTLQTIQY
jgi:hypothetical protein